MDRSVLEWVARELSPRPSTSAELYYDHWTSQSGESLPLIYQPFDVDDQGHWADRGSLFDYLHTTGGGRVLDFGPGDGWPSLILAPYVDQVVGVDGSQRRVDVCKTNAHRMGIDNARFLYVEPGHPLPFDDCSFDSVTAASSLEQTPDPRAALCELYRVLRPEGKLRIFYEALARSRRQANQEAWLLDVGEGLTRLILTDRDIEGERVLNYGVTVRASGDEAMELLAPGREELSYEALTVAALERARSRIVEALAVTLTHPSGRTLLAWMKEIGFAEALPTHSGGYYAWKLYRVLDEARRPADMEALDRYLSPIVETVVQCAAPIAIDPMITAVK
jgi:SAM-dependent methyltransferase